MTADERIERLLNRFGQTILDIPKPNRRICDVSETVMEWYEPAAKEGGIDRLDSYYLEACEWYIHHLAEVIDRMETALETAALTIDCGLCEYWNDDGCGRNCVEIARITDYQLSGLTEREFNDFVEGEGKTDA